MANLIIPQQLSMQQKLSFMEEDACYDISDGDMAARGIFDPACIAGIKAKGNPPKVGKIYVANRCIFDCKYCCHRTSRDFVRPGYLHEPKEMAEICVAAAKENTHGIFLSSAIHQSPDVTEEMIVASLRKMRLEHNYQGYIHAKIMPGADRKLIEEAGWLADRLSINIELPKAEGYLTIARQKNKGNILGPMGDICDLIQENQGKIGPFGRRFARSGQTTQMMIGTMKEPDRTCLVLGEALYKKYRMRRVYYGAFGPQPDYLGDALPHDPVNGWRGRRMYQADRLMQLYKFRADEILPEADPFFQFDVDPKAVWAMRNLHMYPVEVNTATYEELIRVPGIGITSAQKILEARKFCALTHDILTQMRVSLKRARYFITCSGKYTGGGMLGSDALRGSLADKMDQVSLLSADGEEDGFDFGCCGAG